MSQSPNTTTPQSPPTPNDDTPRPQPPSSKNPFLTFKARIVTLKSQLTLPEISGSLGDLGTFIPLLVTLSHQRSILLTPALFFSGLSNFITGFAWDIPMCVQPMKSIAAVALSENLTQLEVTAAGILTGAIILVIGVSNLIEVVNWIVPSNVVSGVQVGIGIRLAAKGMEMVRGLDWVGPGVDCILTGVVLSLLTLYWLRENSTTASLPVPSASGDEGRTNKRSKWRQCLNPFRTCLAPNRDHPVGVYLFLIGAVLSIITLCTTPNPPPIRFLDAPVAVWALGGIQKPDWKIGFLEGAIPQIPLTTLNSVISVCALANSLYPDKLFGERTEVLSRREVSLSVGLMNVVLCPFGAMPNCHGAGGLAGQHRLGARHGASMVFLGFWKMVLAVVLGSFALVVLDAVPLAVLGVMLAIAGIELAVTGLKLMVGSSSGKEVGRCDVLMLRKNGVVAMITVVVIVAFGKAHYGAVSGWIAHMVYGDGIVDLWGVVQKRCEKKCSEEDDGGEIMEQECVEIENETSSETDKGLDSRRLEHFPVNNNDDDGVLNDYDLKKDSQYCETSHVIGMEGTQLEKGSQTAKLE